MAEHAVEFRLLVQDNNPEHSHIGWKHKGSDDNGKRYALASFEPGLQEILRKAFRDMIVFDIRSISGAGIIARKEQDPHSLGEIVALDDESTIINTKDGYRTPWSYHNQEMRDINHALMLLVWKWSPHWSGEDNQYQRRACVVCGKVQWGKPTGLRTGGLRYGPDHLHNNPVREIYTYPHNHCFNPECFSHEIERMIDPAYVFVPPKSGEDLETDLARTLGEKVIKKDHPVGTGVIKKDFHNDPAVQRFIKDME